MVSKVIALVLIVLGTAVILPISIVHLSLKRKMTSERNRKEIILAALEKNDSLNIEELVKKMNVPDKLLKEKLLQKLQWGLATTVLGVIALATTAICILYAGPKCPGDIHLVGIAGSVLFAVGTAFISSYVIGRKLLAKEIEVEEQNLRQDK